MAKQHLALLVLVLLLGTVSLITPASETETIVFSSSNTDAPIYRVDDEKDADTVMLLVVKLPENEYSSKFYLKRNYKPKSIYVGSGIGYQFNACGVTPEGKGVGLGGSVSLSVSKTEVIEVEMFFYWTSAKGNRGQLEGRAAVPWLGETTKDLGQGAHARLSFRKPNK